MPHRSVKFVYRRMFPLELFPNALVEGIVDILSLTVQALTEEIIWRNIFMRENRNYNIPEFLLIEQELTFVPFASTDAFCIESDATDVYVSYNILFIDL